MDRLLLHICCAPCAAYAVPVFRSLAAEVAGWYYNPNIHPLAEYRLRQEALEHSATALGIPMTYVEDYRPEEYFRAVTFHEEDRCRHCYELRLGAAAQEALRRGCEAFSTTLLFSIYQKHDLIQEVGEAIAGEAGIHFLYRDLRPGWQEGHERYRQTGLYRQKYCGCIYSERERFKRKRAGAAPGPRNEPSPCPLPLGEGRGEGERRSDEGRRATPQMGLLRGRHD